MEVESFIHPQGDLTEEMIPDAEDAVAAWITEAEGKSSVEARQRAWVYYRAYTSIANRFHAGLASERKGDAAASVAIDQFTYWRRKASEALRGFAGDTFEAVL